MKRVTLNDTYCLDFSRHEIKNLKGGSVSTIEPRLSQILQILVNQEGQVVSRQTLIEAIWGNYASGDELLTHSICLIRRSLDKSIILTVPKKGYLLVADVVIEQGYAKRIWGAFTFKRVAAVLLVMFILKMIFFPHH